MVPQKRQGSESLLPGKIMKHVKLSGDEPTSNGPDYDDRPFDLWRAYETTYRWLKPHFFSSRLQSDSATSGPSGSGSNSILPISTRPPTDAKPPPSPRVSKPNGPSSEPLPSDHASSVEAIMPSSSDEPKPSKHPPIVSNRTMPCSLPSEGPCENDTCEDTPPVSSPKVPLQQNPPPRLRRKLQNPKIPEEQWTSSAQPQVENMQGNAIGRIEFVDTPVSNTSERPYINREHIHAKQHKARVLAERKRDREQMTKELFRIRRSTGYTSDFMTFQGFLTYKAMLEREYRRELRDMFSPSTSLYDWRSKPVHPPAQDHKRIPPEPLNMTFLSRALQKARDALNGPKPIKPFFPTIEQMRAKHLAQNHEIERRLRPRLPKSLPPEDEGHVKIIMNKKGVVSKFAREQVSESDISRLRPCTWVNDEIINFYGAMILARSEKAALERFNNDRAKFLDIHYFSTFFWPKLRLEGYEGGRLSKWTKNFDIFQKDAILIPINHNNAHWTAACINFRRKRIESYDSMLLQRNMVFKHLRLYLDMEHRNKKDAPFDFTGWQEHSPEDTPQQENGYDCGIFTCQFLQCLSRRDGTFNFGQEDMPYLRRRMIWEIGNAQLRSDL